MNLMLVVVEPDKNEKGNRNAAFFILFNFRKQVFSLY